MRGELILTGLNLIAENPDSIAWRKLEEPGREGVEIFPLYTTQDTGADGPTAALVRYQPGARTQRHLHTSYELIYVLDGVLQNDSGHHRAGTLQVCPPESTHALGSDEGCILLVVWEKPVQPVLQ